jgi:hypothetical protein
MAPQLSTRAIDLVIRLCEQQRAEIAGHVLRMHFGGVGDELIAAGALVEMGPSETVFMPIDLDDQAVAFEWEPDLQAHAAFHPADGWVHADEHSRRRYRLEFPWLLRVIAQQLEVPVATRPASLVPDQLWDLGEAWFGRRKATVLFARRLGQINGLDLVCDALTRRVGRPPGILLTSTRQMSRHVTIPGQHRVLHLTDCMRDDVRGPAIDTDIISGVLNGIRPQRPARLIDPSPDFRLVRALGKSFHFKKGEQQRRIIEYMYQRWLDGDDRVSVAEIVAELDLPEGTRIRDTFKKHPAWGVLLAEEDGSARFLV